MTSDGTPAGAQLRAGEKKMGNDDVTCARHIIIIGRAINLRATCCSLNNKSPVEFPENGSYHLIGIFEIWILTPKREKQPNWGEITYFRHFSPRKNTKF